ncbi:transcriptional pleiotropic regulator of transition state genes [Paenibacillus sp. OK060]|uniref:AbrB/MazE/SpoVT family DNA-binding domain-containing protein n=1 Tax=Paenibacillus sp. OK060 TaxID=1881034 RepID=UPI00088398DC|nr:AbrB/MazE/SpoVT family DNA-binding domain-containing protein [Paenibacillus sp. OK060]SDM16636.1 transcriptional pleiotropic regulator of transition state genes [Paenibacillus sp. OK060]
MRKDRNTGMVRNVDALGRIVLPMELRRTLGIDIGDPFEYFVDDESERLTLRKYRTLECMFCSSTEGLSYFKDYFICGSCLEQVSGNEKLPEGEAASSPEVAMLEEVSNGKEIANKPKWARSKETLFRLAKVMEQYPEAPQKKWAELLGISQGRVSQLVQKLNNTN